MVKVRKYDLLVSLGRISQWIVFFEIDLTCAIAWDLDQLNGDLQNMDLPDHIKNAHNPKFVYAGLNFGILSC